MESVKDELTCSICREVWQEPITLPCQHSLCRQCLAQLLKNTVTREGEHVPCPECRSPFCRMDEYELAEVPTNFKLAEIVRKLQGHASNGGVSCAEHAMPFCVYCVQCQASLCTQCITSHKGHSMGALQTEALSKKKFLQSQIDKCGALVPQFEVSISQLLAARRKIQENENARKGEIVEAYETAECELLTWWKKSVEVLESQHREWRNECNKGIDGLQTRLDKLRESLSASSELLGKADVDILQGSGQIKNELGTQLRELPDMIREKFKLNEDLRKKLNKDQAGRTRIAVHKMLTPGQGASSVEPGYTNTATLNAIAGDEYEDVSLNHYSSFEVRMGTFLSRGSHYWEAKITVSQPQTPHNHCACKTGLLQVGFSWGSPGITSWYVGAQYRSQQFSSYSVSDYEEVSPDYQAWINVTWPHVLGFSLDWPERVLKVFDRAQGKLVCTIRNVNLKKPVVPAVRLELNSKGHVSVDIAEMEYHSLPDDILQLIYAD